MKLNVKDFNDTSKNSMDFKFTIKNLDDIDTDLVEVEGKAKKNSNGKIEIDVHYKTEVELQCVRCLEKITYPLESNFHSVFLDEAEYRQYIKSLDLECEVSLDEIYDEVVDGVIDLSELVREYIILDLPPYPSCYPECNGMLELEKYQKDEIDSRWQQLLKIKN